MSDDLLKRLKRRTILHINEDGYSLTEPVNPDGDEAADEIERLRSENAELLEALAPLIKAIDYLVIGIGNYGEKGGDGEAELLMKFDDLCRARDVFEKHKGK